MKKLFKIQELFLIAFLFCSCVAFSQLEVCNKTDYDFYVAYGYKKGTILFGDWMTKGWFFVESNDCIEVSSNSFKDRNLYWYAESKEGYLITGDYYMCVDPVDAFTIKGQKNCDDRGFVTKGFRYVFPPLEYWTLYIRE